MHLKMMAQFVVCVLLITGLVVDAGEYSYSGDLGASHWSSLFTGCSGHQQSPVNIPADILMDYMSPLQFSNYNSAPTSMTIKNNGHTAQVNCETETTPTIAGGGLEGQYKLAQFHFHWGADNTRGSEHTVNGIRFPLEMHLVHYDANFDSITDAVSSTSSKTPLAVLGVLFQLSKIDNPAFTPIVNALSQVIHDGDEASVVPAYPLRDFLPQDLRGFYRYQGSLTTPTCNEIVTWSVFNKAIPISTEQMSQFRKLVDSHHHPLVDNFRPIQAMNKRKIRFINTGA